MKVRENMNKEIYGFKVEEILESLLMPIIMKKPKNTITIENIELTDESLSLVWKFARRLSEKLDRKPSLFYRILSKSIIPYKLIPAEVRNRVLRARSYTTDPSYVGKPGLEKIRQKFLEVIGYNVYEESVESTCIITHDVDSQKGLERSLRLKEIEERYEVESTWFLLTDEYKLDKKIVKKLAENGEVALHGDKHSVGFYNLNKEEIIKRLGKAKKELEKIVEKEILGFRAPLLQYNRRIIRAISELGFKYDSSMPTWEPSHPLTLKPDGIELIAPLVISGILEIPITLLQDHQMLHILKLTPKDTVRAWINIVNELKKQHLPAVILVHPDYELASRDNIAYYIELIKEIVNNSQTLGKLVKELQYPDLTSC